MRQITALSEYRFTVEHRSGLSNVVADFLSRELVAPCMPPASDPLELDTLTSSDPASASSEPCLGIFTSSPLPPSDAPCLPSPDPSVPFGPSPCSVATSSLVSSVSSSVAPSRSGPDLSPGSWTSCDPSSPVCTTVLSPPSGPSVFLCNALQLHSSIDDSQLHDAQLQDPALATVSSWFAAGASLPSLRVGDPLFSLWHAKRSGHLSYAGGVLRHKERPVIPSQLVPFVLNEAHDRFGAHCGLVRLVRNLSARLWWPSLESDAQDWVSSCVACLNRKPPNRPTRTPLKPIAPTSPLDIIVIDHMGPILDRSSRNVWLLVLICQATRWCEVAVVPSVSAGVTARAIFDTWFSRYALCTAIRSDRGPAFENAVTRELFSLLGVSHIRSSPYRPQTQGIVERFNRTIMESLACLVRENPLDWQDFLPHAILAFRTSFQTSLGCSPYEALFGLPPRTVLDLHFGSAPRSGIDVTERIRRGIAEVYPAIRARIEGRQASWKSQYDRRANARPLSVGDTVALFCPQLKRGVSAKLQGKFSPGFRVLRVVSDWDYLVSNGRFTSLVHRERLRLMPTRSPRLRLNSDVLSSFPCFSSPGASASFVAPCASEKGLRPGCSHQPLRYELIRGAPSCAGPVAPSVCRIVPAAPAIDVRPARHISPRPRRRRLPPDRLTYESLGGQDLPLERSRL